MRSTDSPRTSGGNRRGTRDSFGSLRKLPSGRIQARYTGPDGKQYAAPVTFDGRGDARAWLALRRSEIIRAEWHPEVSRKVRREPLTIGAYAAVWLAERDLKPRTREHYGTLLRRLILPTFGPTPVATITPADVRAWWAGLDPARPTLRAHAYSLLRAILATAVVDDVIVANPCRIRGAGGTKRVHQPEPATLTELADLTAAMPPRYRVMVLFASWCGLRFGELVELRRNDIDLRNGVIRVRRGAVRLSGHVDIGPPKSDAGVRDVAIPPHLVPLVKAHIAEHAAWGRDGLLFPAKHGGTLAPSTLYKTFYPARMAAGRPDLRFHDLRHTGAVLAASTGATLAELMARLGHSTPGAALRYQHAAKGRDTQIAAALSKLAERVAP